MAEWRAIECKRLIIIILRVKVPFRTLGHKYIYTHTTHANTTSVSQPAIAVNRRGPKSRAGFTAYPELMPIEEPIAHSTTPIINGFKPALTSLFFASVIANIPIKRMKVPINCMCGKKEWILHARAGTDTQLSGLNWTSGSVSGTYLMFAHVQNQTCEIAIKWWFI